MCEETTLRRCILGSANKCGVTVHLDLTWTTTGISLLEGLGAFGLFGDTINMAIPCQFGVNVKAKVFG